VRRTFRAAALSGALLLAGGGCGDAPAAGTGGSGAKSGAATAARPAPLTTHSAQDGAAPTVAQIDAAMARGVAYLVGSQNKDGSWGSTAPTLYCDIYAPGPDAQRAYGVATSALAVSALIETGAGKPGADDAVRRGLDYLVANCRVRRASIDVLYNVWAHAYCLEAFARALPGEKDESRRAAMRKAGAVCVDMLQRFEYAEGGWGYYDFDTHTARPGNMATSFSTATVLVALKMAKDQGIEVPQRLVDRGIRLLGMLRKPDGSFAYSWDHRYYPQGGINKIKGSLARTPACYDAFRSFPGNDRKTKVTDEQVATALENLRKEGRFLAIARKYPYPHETWYQNSGYFTFYGYYHASRILGALTPERRAVEAASMATYLVPIQEEDGSWWDYQLYGYHKPYGTAYVLMTLSRCRG
jgi:hypothetical protein